MVFLWCIFGCVLGFKWGVFVKFTPFQLSINDYLCCFWCLLGWFWVVFGFCLASNKRCRCASLFTAPADAARQERCLWSVSRVRRARDGRFYRSRLASVTVYASPSPFSDERPSSRFRGIALPSKRRRLRYSTVGLTRYRTR